MDLNNETPNRENEIREIASRFSMATGIPVISILEDLAKVFISLHDQESASITERIIYNMTHPISKCPGPSKT